MTKEIKRIVIVGGGTAGWLSAAHLAKHFRIQEAGTPEIVLIESEEIGRIGVGEATLPTIRYALQYLGIDEFEFMRATSATFKQAIRFENWAYNPGTAQPNAFYHTFQLPFRVRNASPLAYWIKSSRESEESYVDFAVPQGKICDAGLAPFQYNPRSKPNGLMFAYHFDANQFAFFLKEYSISRGVKHHLGSVTEVTTDPNGDIFSLKVKDQPDLKGDLFVDCTGFSAHLIERKLGSKFKSANPILFCDKAVTLQVPYDRPDEPIRPFTLTTAQENGWTWDIGLTNRRGIGYVYSSRHSTPDRAEEVLRQYIGTSALGLTPRHLDMRVGYRDQQWVKNCIAIGLSAGFLEPLESTGIAQVTLALNRLVNSLNLRGHNEFARTNFNNNMSQWFSHVIEFIKMHYCLTKRTDSAFWTENTHPDSIPDRLKELLDALRWRPMNVFDQSLRHAGFGEDSYEQILVGMGCVPDISGEEHLYPYDAIAGVKHTQVGKQVRLALSALPTHREVIDRINST